VCETVASATRFIVAAACACACACIVPACRSSIATDENVILFPTYAVEDGPSSWTARVGGWIYEPERGELRGALLAQLQTLLGERFGLREQDFQAKSHFADRAGMFLADNQRRKQVSVTVGGLTVALGESEANGHFEGTVTLTGSRTSGEWADLRAVTQATDLRVFAGRVQFIGRRGVSVVSDIDDTIKDSNVLDTRELGANTFLRDYRAAPGMADLYQRWAASGHVVFHYVSGSPFQLFPALADFRRLEKFPEGSFHLRRFRLKDRSALEFFGDPFEFKIGVIDRLMRQFPERTFIFVGDSGERDPEVYGTLASRYPSQVAAILIRDVGGEGLTSPSVVQLYAALPAHIRRVFRDPRELDDFRLPDVASTYRGAGYANSSTFDRFTEPAMPWPPPGESMATPTSSTLLKFGFTTSVSTITLAGSNPYHRMPLNAISTERNSPWVSIRRSPTMSLPSASFTTGCSE
jgi:phosphatidate phosphatase APP1